MLVENDPSARMQLRPAGELRMPAACAVCGNGTCEEGFLDLDCFVEFHGMVYLCMNCLIQAGEAAGMFTREQVEHLNGQMTMLLEQNEILTSELADANESVRSLNHLLARKFDSERLPEQDVSKDVKEPVSVPADRESETKKPVVSKKSSGTSGTKLHDITFD